jgi:hypothetical protein
VSDAPQPAPFVVGVGRSGTTLLRLMLDAHPALAIPPETHFVPALIESFRSGTPARDALVDAVTAQPSWRDLGFDEDALGDVLGGHSDPAEAIRAFFGAYAERHGKPRWGDKTPVYIESIATIGAALPEAHFVHLIRDGRDVAVSRRARAAKRGREPTPAAEEAATWKRRIEGAREQGDAVAHYREWRYEDLVAEAEPVLREICEYVELPFEPAMLDYHRHAAERLSELSDLESKKGKVRPRSERIEAHALTSEPPREDRLGRWRTELSADEIAAFESVAGDLLGELGYEVSA